ncbi:MAG: type II secretion system F family protein [Planctomycetota bacterium]
MLKIVFAILGFVALLVALVAAWRWLSMRTRSQQRWFEASGGETSNASADASGLSDMDRRGLLGRWLYRAGYRGPTAVPLFLLATAVCTAIGLTVALLFTFSGLQTVAEQIMVGIPGGVGETFLPVVWVAPWLIFLLIGFAPLLVVRAARRQRVETIEQDLPLSLELLSTLSEAGLGFDVAVSRIQRTRLGGRALASEFQFFQADLLGGRSRVESLRRLSSRIDVPSVSVFVSALVQAEQIGMGIARVLRQQAEDVRARRRERAIAFANSLATKRVIPMVICFLPGLFVWALGPALVQLFKMVDGVLEVGNI